MLSDYQLNVADHYNILIANVQKLVPKFFHKEKYDSFWKFETLLDARIKTKKNKKSHQSQWLKQYVDFNTQKKNRSRKKQGQRFKSTNNSVYRKIMENLRQNRCITWQQQKKTI